MGFIAAHEAFQVLDRFEKLCREQTGKSNCYKVEGKEYFYEISRKDQPDNGICGAIFVLLENDLCRKVGTFKIDSDGRVVRGPAVMKKYQAKPMFWIE